MNKVRREMLKNACKKLEAVTEIIELVRDEESDAFDNMPEGLQESDRGITMQENIETLEDIISNLEDISSELEGII